MSQHETHHSAQVPPGMTPVYYLPQQEPPDDEINLLDYWRVLVERKWLIALFSFLSTAIATTVALTSEPIFKAEVMFMPADEDKAGGLSGLASQFGGLAALAGVNLGGAGGGKSEEALATLKSRAFTIDFINENKLMPILFATKWDEAAQKWKVEKKEDIPTEWDAYKTFSVIRTVNKEAKTGVLTLSVEWKDPELAAQWANGLIKKLNAHQKNKTIGEAQKSINYLQEQIAQTSIVDMQQTFYRIIEAQTKNAMLASTRDDFAFKVIDPAVVPEEREKPKRKLMVILGFVVGVMLGVFVAFFMNFIKNQREQAKAASTK